MVGQSLCVIARRGRDHAARRFLCRHREQPVQRPSLLERTRHLQVLELEENLVAGHFREGERLYTRRQIDGVSNAFSSAFDIAHG